MIAKHIDSLCRKAGKVRSVGNDAVHVVSNGDLVMFIAGSRNGGSQIAALLKKFRGWLMEQTAKFYVQKEIEHVLTTETLLMIRIKAKAMK